MFESSNLGLSTRGNVATAGIVQRTEDSHPLVHIRSLVDSLFDEAQATTVKWAPLIRAALLQALYSFSTDEHLLEQLRYNALYRWFVGLRDDELLWRESDYASALAAMRGDSSATTLFRSAANAAYTYAVLVPGRFRMDSALIESWARAPAPSISNSPEGFRSDAARTSRLDRARAAILRRVSDPTLDADAVAAELHMSRRALYLLFERYGLTPTRAIREIRLDCCLRMLRDEHHCHRKIADIAMDHGFKHFASFSRQFKMRYGISPSAVLPSIAKSEPSSRRGEMDLRADGLR